MSTDAHSGEDSFLPDDGYDRRRTAHHEAGHVVARWVVYGTVGAASIRKQGDMWGSSDAQPLPDSLLDGGSVRRGSHTPLERRLLKKLILCVLAGSAAGVRFSRLLSADEIPPDLIGATTLSLLETKDDDQVAVWDVAGKLWPDTRHRDDGVERLSHSATRLVSKNGSCVERVASELLKVEAMEPAEVKRVLTTNDPDPPTAWRV